MKEKLVVSKFSDAERQQVQKDVASAMQADWLARVAKETKVDGRKLLDELIARIRKYEPTSSYTPGFELYEKKCGKA